MRIISEGLYSSDCVSDEYIQINSCGYQMTSDMDLTVFRKNGRSDYQIIYIDKGCGYFKVNGKDIEVKSGNLLIYKPYEPQIYTYYSKDNTHGYWIHFTGAGVEEILKKCGLNKDFVYFIGQFNEFKDAVAKLIKEFQLQSFQQELLCQGLFICLLSTVSRQIQQFKNTDENEKYEKIMVAIETIHNHYYEDTSNDEYAMLCNLSKYYFLHLFKQFTSLSPQAYKTQIRIEKAKDLLSNTTLNVSEIAENLGYSDSLYFSRLFKKHLGQSPSLYKSCINDLKK